jgi:hypothetical protein
MRVLVTNVNPTPAEPWFGSFLQHQVDAADLERSVAGLGLSKPIAIKGSVPHKTVLERVIGAFVSVNPKLRTPLNRLALSMKLFELSWACL